MIQLIPLIDTHTSKYTQRHTPTHGEEYARWSQATEIQVFKKSSLCCSLAGYVSRTNLMVGLQLIVGLAKVALGDVLLLLLCAKGNSTMRLCSHLLTTTSMLTGLCVQLAPLLAGV